jgi:hypothetical protein
MHRRLGFRYFILMLRSFGIHSTSPIIQENFNQDKYYNTYGYRDENDLIIAQ